jgi:hypothetical protein
MQTNVCK